MSENKKGKILLIKLTSLGDVIYNIPLANSLKDAGYEVSWLVSEKGYDVVNNNPAVTKTFLAPMGKWKKQKNPIANFTEYLKILKEIRKEKYDIAIDTQQMFKSLIWMLFCGAKRRIMFQGGRDLSFLGANEIIPKKFDKNKHCVDNFLEFAKYLNVEPKVKFSLPASSKDTIQKVDKLLEPINKSKPIVIISPATTRHLKHWHKKNWLELIEGIKDSCSLVFTAGEKEKKIIEEIGGNNFLNLSGKTNIKDLIELFSRAKIVITPDSGSAQMAWALNKPSVITIFTMTPWHMYGPFEDGKKYFKVHGKKTCQPCYLQKCSNQDENFEICRKLPEAKEIINIVNNLLKNTENGV